eukprot:CAMPEP_0201521086 /NCGR_PEP_ID=MMETSP0161_2-20130828/14076_1 /ASSEMBLY_ACC=CAM_ASM_000251 /TAXON_ID=180227 /ORGANISM="Neoparamoeba aestuarina, Strain SoJaBio B1-5/56/2" /LENGTH=118 /DNA_ID=CAMNT_0047919653 /DNA_START=97 /DNA_END=453 /DNA_ORIENTATION=+
MKVHYIEIVTTNVDEQVKTLEGIHGVKFSEPQADLGNARVADLGDGSYTGVRGPLGAHETPILRTYVEVPDINQAIKTAEASGGITAYPPTVQGSTGIWAIYIQDGIQHGLWQKEAEK